MCKEMQKTPRGLANAAYLACSAEVPVKDDALVYTKSSLSGKTVVFISVTFSPAVMTC